MFGVEVSYAKINNVRIVYAITNNEGIIMLLLIMNALLCGN